MTVPIVIGVSACLLGEHVRYDGGHKHNRYITDTLGAYFALVPVCPEVGCGLPTPREAMRLEGDPSAPRLMARQTRIDRTGQMLAYSAVKVRELESANLCGFIFKERSPSCGPTGVPVLGGGASGLFTTGLFAHEIVSRWPLMPAIGDESLNDPNVRESFIERVLSHCRCKAFLAGKSSWNFMPATNC